MPKNIFHITSVDDFDAVWLGQFLEKTAHLKANCDMTRRDNTLHRTVVATLFYEPSTRTRLSFESAALKLGAGVISTENAGLFSSAIKGESLEDTIRVVECYAEAIVLRHTEVGAAKRGANISSIPIINAGDGSGEHPTQALLDFFTIWEKCKQDTDTSVLFVGDLMHGRTVHSLIKLIARLKNTEMGFIRRIVLASPNSQRLPPELRQLITEAGVSVIECNALTTTVVQESRVVYMTRTQTERGSDPAEKLVLKPELVSAMRQDQLILHPMPRNEELPTTIDNYPQAYWLQQARNGLFVRMQLLSEILG